MPGAMVKTRLITSPKPDVAGTALPPRQQPVNPMPRQWRTVEEIDAEARDLGAVTKVIHSIRIPVWSYTEGRHCGMEPWSDHYFNQEGREIAYCIRDLLSAGHGLHVLPQPRTWDDYFLSLDTNTFVDLSLTPAAAGESDAWTIVLLYCDRRSRLLFSY